MAYKDVEHGYVTSAQSDLPWTQTFRMTLRAPGIANRVFDTLAHAQAYVNDTSSKASAVKGLILAVTDDTNPNNIGLWYVASVKESASDPSGELKQIFRLSLVLSEIFDTDGKIKSQYLPSYVDDILEGYFYDGAMYKTRTGAGTAADPYGYSDPYTGETGKIYVNLPNNYSYRWSGSTYVLVSAPDALEIAMKALKTAKAGL